MTRRRAMMGLAAADQLHEAQAGVKMGYDQPSFDAASTRWVSTPIPIGKEDFSIEYYGNTFGASLAGLCTLFNAAQPENYAPGCLMAYPNPLGSNGIMAVIYEGGGLQPAFYAGEQQAFHFVLTRCGRTMTIYINNVVKATTELAAVNDFADFRMGLANSSLIVHTRIFNHALSASEVTALYNAGKPEKWVLPTAMKDRSPVQITSGSSYVWTDEASAYYGIAVTSRPFTEGQTYKIKVTVSDFVSGAPFILLGNSAHNQTIAIPWENGTHEVYGTFRGGFIMGVLFYGGMSGADRRLTLTIDSIEPVGCIAEWLPQNLRPEEWLDSAKQLPSGDDYLPPLRGSMGGYDMAANGTPEIILKPIT